MGKGTSTPAIGETIARLRGQRGWSLEVLEGKSGVAKSTIHNLESGKQRGTRVENLKGLADAFGLSLEALYAGAPEDSERLAS